MEGLHSNPKYIDSRYFYDDRGSKIFQEIMRMPEYYLTDCELEIFRDQKQDILDSLMIDGQPVDLVELGAGDGLKTKILLDHFHHSGHANKYVPVDISPTAVIDLQSDIRKDIPGLKVEGLIGDYFNIIRKLNASDGRSRLLLFLGSNIGNFEMQDALDFLGKVKDSMRPGDFILIGFDLKKDPEIIMNAYNDPHGHTAAFNLNLLQRINNELDADFDLERFAHEEVYKESTGEARSYLISKGSQTVSLRKIGELVRFENQESIFTEISQKYDETMVQELAERTGFEIIRNFYDERKYFMDSLWKLQSGLAM